MDMIFLGMQQAFTLETVYYCLIGVVVGMAVGVLPGISSIVAMSLLFPLTFYLEPVPALVMLAGIYYGAEYGGSVAAILLNLPGTPSSAVTAIDGYQMARNGKPGVALFVTTVASFIGGSVGILAIMFMSGAISAVGLAFGSAEYFSVVVFGLVAASTVGNDSPLHGLAMMTVGMLIACIGLDTNSAMARFTFGILDLRSGIDMVPLVMGLFGVATVVMSIASADQAAIKTKITMRSMLPSRDDIKRSLVPIARGSVIGSIVGILPGTGTTMASFIAYGFEKRFKRPDTALGQGAVEGVASPEAANNAASQTAFIPTLTLGLPGSASMAIIFGALLVNGITPGPLLITQRPDIFWGLIASFWLGNLLLLILNIPLVGIWVRLLQVPYRLLFPIVITLVCVGTYSVNFNPFDTWTTLVFSALGVLFVVLRFQPAPLLLGFILGPLAEIHFRNTMSLSSGSFSGLASSWISAIFLTATLVMLAATIYGVISKRRLKSAPT